MVKCFVFIRAPEIYKQGQHALQRVHKQEMRRCALQLAWPRKVVTQNTFTKNVNGATKLISGQPARPRKL